MANFILPNKSFDVSSDHYLLDCQENKQVAPVIYCKQQTDSPKYSNVLNCTEKILTQPQNSRLSRKRYSKPSQHQGENTAIKRICIDYPPDDPSSSDEYSIKSDLTFKEHSKFTKLKEASSGEKHTCSDNGIAHTSSYVQSQINFGHSHTNIVSASQNSNLEVSPYSFRIISAENLNLKYAKIFSKGTADLIFHRLEKEVEYFPNDLSKVKVFGKWYNIPRKQVSYGDSGLSYAFSGTCVPAVAWSKCNIVMCLKEIVESVCKHSFNFVLINRYKDGKDHMGEHRDDEKDLVANAPIASLSFGQVRDFVFKHKDARGVKCKRKIDPITLKLEHGSLLLMESPTNHFWYHSLPVRAKAPNIRINLTFREMVKKN